MRRLTTGERALATFGEGGAGDPRISRLPFELFSIYFWIGFYSQLLRETLAIQESPSFYLTHLGFCHGIKESCWKSKLFSFSFFLMFTCEPAPPPLWQLSTWLVSSKACSSLPAVQTWIYQTSLDLLSSPGSCGTVQSCQRWLEWEETWPALHR